MEIKLLEKSIISTLGYFEALGEYPLTSFEIYKYLNRQPRTIPACREVRGKQTTPNHPGLPGGTGQADNPEKKSKIFHGAGRQQNVRPHFLRLLETLDDLKRKGIVKSRNGFYSLENVNKFYSQRIERQKIAEKKWKKLKKYIKLFYLLPFIKMVAVTGSLAFNNTRKESDLDLLLITKRGRIWMVRIFCSFLTHIMGVRRYDTKIQDRICLNYYLAHNSLEIYLKNLSNAYTYAEIIPLIGENWWEKFQKSNWWVKNYLAFYPFKTAYYFRILSRPEILGAISKIIEEILSTKIGDLIEAKFKKWQKEKILKKVHFEDLDNKKYLSLSDESLMFHHPISRNEEVEEKYNRIINKALKLLV